MLPFCQYYKVILRISAPDTFWYNMMSTETFFRWVNPQGAAGNKTIIACQMPFIHIQLVEKREEECYINDMPTIELSPAENLALNLLRSSGEIQKLSRPDGTINLDDLHQYFRTLTRKLEYALIRRRNEYIDVNKEILNAVEHHTQTSSS